MSQVSVRVVVVSLHISSQSNLISENYFKAIVDKIIRKNVFLFKITSIEIWIVLISIRQKAARVS